MNSEVVEIAAGVILVGFAILTVIGVIAAIAVSVEGVIEWWRNR